MCGLYNYKNLNLCVFLPKQGGLVSLNYPLTGTTSVPTYFGPTGVAPLSATGMNYSGK